MKNQPSPHRRKAPIQPKRTRRGKGRKPKPVHFSGGRVL